MKRAAVLVSMVVLFLLNYPLAQAQDLVPGSACALTATLARGDTDASTGGQVTVLQKFLAEHYGLSPTGFVTGFFGSLTKEQVARFQIENGLDPVGVVGERTKEKIRSLCVTAKPFVPSPISAEVSTRASTVAVVADGLYNAYSPAVLDYKGVRRMWIGGWEKESDVGSDVIYYTEIKDGKAAELRRSFSYPGHLANDPSVIVNPRNSNELLMFFTALKEEHATAEEMTKKNWVAVARSVDGGKTWRAPKIVIGQDNGLDGRGAWSPSALVVGNEIWLYYNANDGNPDIYRTRLDARTLAIVATDATTKGGSRLSGINVEVKKVGSRYVMLLTTSLTEMMRYVSTDGLTWRTDGASNPVLVAAEGASIVTPSLFVDGGKAGVYFAGGPLVAGGNYRYSSINFIPDVTAGPFTFSPVDRSVRALPDYVITAAEAVLAKAGGTDTIRSIKVTVKNQGGDIDNTAPLAVQAFGAGGLPTFQASILPIDAGKEKVVELTTTNFAFSYRAGSFTYTAKVDTTGAVRESVENNNELVFSSTLGTGNEVMLSVNTCVPGRGRSASARDNAVVCDATVSWQAPGEAYVVVTGDFPYNRDSFPQGFALPPARSGSAVPFWVTTGNYTATLYTGGLPPNGSIAGTGRAIKSQTFTIGRPTRDIGTSASVIQGAERNITSDWTRDGKLLGGFLNMYNGHIVYEEGEDYPYKMWFFGWAVHICNNPSWPSGSYACDAIYFARSVDGKNWQVYSGGGSFDSTENPSLWEPVITAQNYYYDQVHVGDPSVVKVGSTYYMVYSANGNDLDGIPGGMPGDTDGYYNSIMGAVSDDGIRWQRTAGPSLAASGERGGVDTAAGNMYNRPSLMYEDGKFRMWFDYWVSDTKGTGMGYAEMEMPATRNGFLRGTWEVLRAGSNPMIANFTNPDVVKVGNEYRAYGDPVVDTEGIWTARKIVEATSRDGLSWKITGYLNPDSGCAATHVPEAYVVDGKLNVTYGCQQGGSPYNEHYKEIRSMYQVVDTGSADAVGSITATGCTISRSKGSCDVNVYWTSKNTRSKKVDVALVPPSGEEYAWSTLNSAWRNGAPAARRTTITYFTVPGTWEARLYEAGTRNLLDSTEIVVAGERGAVAGISLGVLTSSRKVEKGTLSDTGRFDMVFEVTAGDQDVYVPNGAVRGRDEGPAGVNYLIRASKKVESRGITTATLASGAEKVGDYYLVKRGETKEFTLSVAYEPAATGFYTLLLHSVNYAAAPTAPQSYQQALPEKDFETAAAVLGVREASKVATPCNGYDTLQEGKSLNSGWSFLSCNKQYRLSMQADGNLVLSGPAGALWNSGTAGSGATKLTMQIDGNLVLYTRTGKAVWSLLNYQGARMIKGQYLQLKDDGTLAVYDQSGTVRWNTGMPLKTTAPASTATTNSAPTATTPEAPTNTQTPEAPKPTGSISVTTCTPGLGKSAQSPDNALTCDITFSWSTKEVTNAYAVIRGDLPYDSQSYPLGFYLGEGTTKSGTPLWVTNGTYTITLYGNGFPDGSSWQGSAQVLDTKTFTISTPAASRNSLNQMASVLEALRALLNGWR